ncbi:MAG: YqgE/AlgH family protein [Rhodospirillaceae bacterium]
MKRLLILVVLLLALPQPAIGAEKKPTLAGRMLVASEKLKDPFFQHSVVYIIEHDANGAIGLIVNRRMGEGSLAQLVDELGFSLPEDRHVELYFGGPVSLRGVFVLHSPEYDGPRTLKAPDGLAMTGDKSIIRAIANGRAPKQIRLMMGYAGWGAGQLEDEVERGDWLDAPADNQLIFEEGGDADDIWKRARDKAGLTL